MKNYKYPAPFDVPNQPNRNLYLDPNTPLPPSPPLPIDATTNGPDLPRDSLYEELFGNDVSVLCLILDDPQYSQDQRTLSAEILSGRKKLKNLSAQDEELLDGLVRSFNEELDEGESQKVKPLRRQGLPGNHEMATSTPTSTSILALWYETCK